MAKKQDSTTKNTDKNLDKTNKDFIKKDFMTFDALNNSLGPDISLEHIENKIDSLEEIGIDLVDSEKDFHKYDENDSVLNPQLVETILDEDFLDESSIVEDADKTEDKKDTKEEHYRTDDPLQLYYRDITGIANRLTKDGEVAISKRVECSEAIVKDWLYSNEMTFSLLLNYYEDYKNGKLNIRDIISWREFWTDNQDTLGKIESIKESLKPVSSPKGRPKTKHLDKKVFDEFNSAIAGEELVVELKLDTADPMSRLAGSEVVVTLFVKPGLVASELEVIMHRIMERWSASEVIASCVDSMTLMVKPNK
jgi:biotin operon repressor